MGRFVGLLAQSRQGACPTATGQSAQGARRGLAGMPACWIFQSYRVEMERSAADLPAVPSRPRSPERPGAMVQPTEAPTNLQMNTILRRNRYTGYPTNQVGTVFSPPISVGRVLPGNRPTILGFSSGPGPVLPCQSLHPCMSFWLKTTWFFRTRFVGFLRVWAAIGRSMPIRLVGAPCRRSMEPATASSWR